MYFKLTGGLSPMICAYRMSNDEILKMLINAKGDVPPLNQGNLAEKTKKYSDKNIWS